MTADIGLIGLAVMGQNLVLNMDDNGYAVAVYNRTTEKTDAFLAGPAAGTKVIPTSTLDELVATLATPRRVMLMVKAGDAVDAVIGQLVPLLDEGDIIIDGGNSRFDDTIRRTHDLEDQGLLFIGNRGLGRRGRGPLRAIDHAGRLAGGLAARAGDVAGDLGQGRRRNPVLRLGGLRRCGTLREDGAQRDRIRRHADHRRGLPRDEGGARNVARRYGCNLPAMGQGRTRLVPCRYHSRHSRLHGRGGHPNAGGHPRCSRPKRTGKWTAISSLELGQPLTLVAEAVYARIVSALKEQRVAAAEIIGSETTPLEAERDGFVEAIRYALYASKIVSYAQGFMLLREAAAEYGWDLDYGRIAQLWREGCIIRGRVSR